MPRKNLQRATGIWEKVPGSGVWWIRYRVDGELKREKVGRESDAVTLYQQQKSEVRAGKKLLSNLRNAGTKFKDIADPILKYSASQHKDTKHMHRRVLAVSKGLEK